MQQHSLFYSKLQYFFRKSCDNEITLFLCLHYKFISKLKLCQGSNNSIFWNLVCLQMQHIENKVVTKWQFNVWVLTFNDLLKILLIFVTKWFSLSLDCSVLYFSWKNWNDIIFPLRWHFWDKVETLWCILKILIVQSYYIVITLSWILLPWIEHGIF